MKRKETLQKLTTAEEEIMQIIWKLGPCLVKDIIAQLPGDEIPHSTISSVVRILEKKGFVDHKAYGKTHEYYPVVTKETYAQLGVQTLMEKYFSGSPKQLVSFLVQNKDMKLKELNELMEMLQSKKKQP